MRILVVTAMRTEHDRLAPVLGDATLIASGIGPVAAAVATANALAIGSFDLVLNLGICGAFTGAVAEDIVVGSASIAADLGSESADGFLSLDDLGHGPTILNPDTELISTAAAGLRDAGVPVVISPILTLTTCTGTAQTTALLRERWPDAHGEAMEGFGVASAAQAAGVPWLEVRSISNLVGPRNREAWRVSAALDLLVKGAPALLTAVSRDR